MFLGFCFGLILPKFFKLLSLSVEFLSKKLGFLVFTSFILKNIMVSLGCPSNNGIKIILYIMGQGKLICYKNYEVERRGVIC